MYLFQIYIIYNFRTVAEYKLTISFTSCAEGDQFNFLINDTSDIENTIPATSTDHSSILDVDTWVLASSISTVISKNFVGQIIKTSPLTIKCMRRVLSSKKSQTFYSFVWPSVDDIKIIEKYQIIDQLKAPEITPRGLHKFIINVAINPLPQ